jgi:hypothetical protein
MTHDMATAQVRQRLRMGVTLPVEEGLAARQLMELASAALAVQRLANRLDLHPEAVGPDAPGRGER